jgi:phosphatidylglycerophosphate synthase
MVETATRQMSFLLAAPERRILRWIAARLPGAWMPDHLTAIGILGAVMVGAGYALTTRHPAWLWLATSGLAVNWFGDSLDGTLARVRQIERPKYGYYIDHMVDAINTTTIGVGLGLSPFVAMPLAMLLVILYLCLSINVYLESSVHGQFDLGFGIIGPTEVRILMAALNTALFAVVTWTGAEAVAIARVASGVVVVVCAGLAFALVSRFRINLIRLSRIEPPRRKTDTGASVDSGRSPS